MTEAPGPGRRGRPDAPDETFDRIRPPSERMLGRDGDGHLPGPHRSGGVAGSGRATLFSAGRLGVTPGGLAVRCGRCGHRTPLGVRTALKAVVPVVAVAPWRRAPLFARCPACARRGWLAIERGA